MKKSIFKIILLLLTSLNLFAQKPSISFPAISGHYKELAKLSGKSLPDSTDFYQFPVEGLPLTTWTRLTFKPRYLLAPVTDFKIPDFPANSSVQTKAEIEFLLKLQETARTTEKVKESLDFAGVYYSPKATPESKNWVKLRNNMFHMGRQLKWFNPDKLPITANFMAKVWADCSYYFWALKYKFNRTRPYMLDARLKNLDDTNFQAYPSGHSSASYMAAFVYQEILPEHKDLFLKNAYDMAFSREIIGVHFPSDSEAGRVFARQFVNMLLLNPAFQKDMLAAKMEIENVKKTLK